VTTFNDKQIDIKLNSIKRRWGPDSDEEDGSDWFLLANVEDNSHLHRQDDFPFNVVSGPHTNPRANPNANNISVSTNSNHSRRSSHRSITITSENYDLNNSDDEFYFGTPIANSFI
jgi:hypothetical protein